MNCILMRSKSNKCEKINPQAWKASNPFLSKKITQNIFFFICKVENFDWAPVKLHSLKSSSLMKWTGRILQKLSEGFQIFATSVSWESRTLFEFVLFIFITQPWHFKEINVWTGFRWGYFGLRANFIVSFGE